MNILIIAPNEIAIPPYKGYGGTERVVYDLALQFAEKGHTVDIICEEGSKVNCRGVSLLPSPQAGELHFIRNYLSKHQQTYDIIHLHIFQFEYVKWISRLVSPLVTSIHYYIGEEKAAAFDALSSYYLVQSKAQERFYRSHLEQVKGILQGIRTEHIPFSSKTFKDVASDEITLEFQKDLKKENVHDYLLILSKISSRKGQLTAIKLAKDLNLPLVIAGEPKNDYQGAQKTSIEYFHNTIKPLIDNRKIFYFGNAGEYEKYELMKYARGFIFPTGFEDEWQEAFGRVVAESLATGTPVVAHDNGAMSEQLTEGENGYLFRTYNEALEKLKKVDQISRTYCRDDAVHRLSSERFAKEYLEYYKRLTH